MTFWLIIHFRFFHYQFFHYYSPKPSPARLVVRQAFIIIASEIPNHDIVRTRFVPLRTLRQQKKRHQKYGSDPIYHQQQSYTSHTSHHDESLRNAAFCGYRHGNHGEISRGWRSLLFTLEAMVLAWLRCIIGTLSGISCGIWERSLRYGIWGEVYVYVYRTNRKSAFKIEQRSLCEL